MSVARGNVRGEELHSRPLRGWSRLKIAPTLLGQFKPFGRKGRTTILVVQFARGQAGSLSYLLGVAQDLELRRTVFG
jgi:hypothetical protein